MTQVLIFWNRMALISLLGMSSLVAGDWQAWRGPNGNGIADSDAKPPSEWGEEKNVKWKVIIPGRGHASPTVCGDLTVVATATDDAQFVIAYDRDSGNIRWKQRVHNGGLPDKLHKKNTAASSTIVSDGKHFFALFHNNGKLVLTALDRSGNQVWQKDTGHFECDYKYGYAASPTLYKDFVIVASDSKKGYLAAFQKSDGSEAWRTPREVPTSYSSPIVGYVAGKSQLLISGTEKVSSYDPMTGKLQWEGEGTCPVTCGTLVWSDNLVFASGGFPIKKTIAMRADGSGEIVWENGDKSYEQSLLYHNGHLYTFNDNGIAICWNAETGEEKWKVRLGGPVSASPILANGLIHAINERGITHVFRPNPAAFEKVGEFQVGDEGFATPVFVGNQIFIRTAEQGVHRQEFLYCISEE